MPKLSLNQAITLITLRLGKLENSINELHHGDGNINIATKTDDNLRLIDKDLLMNLITRIDSLEKNQTLQDEEDEQIELNLTENSIIVDLLARIDEVEEKYQSIEMKMIDFLQSATEIDPLNIILSNDNIIENDSIELITNENVETSEYDTSEINTALDTPETDIISDKVDTIPSSKISEIVNDPVLSLNNIKLEISPTKTGKPQKKKSVKII